MMKTFDQLTQDQQMLVVEKISQELIQNTADGITPQCFRNFTREIDTAIDQALDIGYSFIYCLQSCIDNNPTMKLAMLHQAEHTAKKAVYLEDGEISITLDNIGKQK